MMRSVIQGRFFMKLNFFRGDKVSNVHKEQVFGEMFGADQVKKLSHGTKEKVIKEMMRKWESDYEYECLKPKKKDTMDASNYYGL